MKCPTYLRPRARRVSLKEEAPDVEIFPFNIFVEDGALNAAGGEWPVFASDFGFTTRTGSMDPRSSKSSSSPASMASKSALGSQTCNDPFSAGVNGCCCPRRVLTCELSERLGPLGKTSAGLFSDYCFFGVLGLDPPLGGDLFSVLIGQFVLSRGQQTVGTVCSSTAPLRSI